MHFRHIVLAACMLGCLGASACALGAQNAPALQIRNAWVRWLPGNLPAGGYVTLINTSNRPTSLVAASCPDYAQVSLHRSLEVGGISRMMPVEKITIAAHSSLEFAGNGYHLMLEHPKKPLQPGDRVTVTLSFAGGSEVTVPFELRPPDAVTDRPDMPGMAH